MGTKFAGEDDVIADINITPFVDIILVVLIIFMVTATKIAESSIKLNLPQAASGEPGSTSIGLTLTAGGQLLLDGKPSDATGVRSALQTAKRSSEEVVVLIAADRDVAHGRVVWVMDLVKSEGIGKFAINIDQVNMIPPDPGVVQP